MTFRTRLFHSTWPAYASTAWLVAFIGWHAPMLFGWNPFEVETSTNLAVFLLYDAALIWIAAAGVVVVLATVRPAPAGFAGLVDKTVEAATGAELYVGYAVNLFFFLGAVLLVPATVSFLRPRQRVGRRSLT